MRFLPLLFLIVLPPVVAHAAPPEAWPTKGWPASTPEAQGLNRSELETFDRELAAGQQGYVDSMLVIRHGAVVFEKSYPHDYDSLFVGKGAPGLYNYYDPAWHPYWKHGELHTMQSVSKSFTSALVGIAIRRGEIPGVQAKVMPYFSAFKTPPDPRRDAMTLRDVLTMTTGIRWDESSSSYTNTKNNCAEMEATEDWIQYVLEQPMAFAPGQQFEYNSGATELLSYVIKKTTGQEADDYAKEHLLGPLGIEYAWKRTPKGLADTEGGLYLRPRDLAKFGLLYLRDGVWEGKRILPEGWVKDSTTWHTGTSRGRRGYGYKWWVLSRKGPGTYEAYAALGYGGQRLIVVPELDLIAVFTGWNIYDKPELDPTVALGRVLRAVQDRPAPAAE
ncbi:MAG TPA: serine hydrolase [Vicinamibacteria bacterium]|nr:serine hydrolase [Vicinamibacteria bacterium]